jgi:hypothetical protein
MRFELTQSFDAPVGRVLDLFTDPEFYAGLTDLTRVATPEPVERTVVDGRVLLRLRYRFIADLPPGAGRFVSADRLTWVEESTFDPAAGTQQLEMQPDHYADRLTASAAVTWREREGTTERAIVGDLRIHFPLVGGRVERAIVDGLREHLEQEAQQARRRLAA